MRDPIREFSRETFAGRREAAMASLEDAVMILPSSPVRFRSRDTEYRYRPDSELFYLTGWTEPEAVAVFSGGPGEGGGTFILFVPERDPRKELWTGVHMGPEEALEASGAQETFPLSELGRRLPKLLEKPRKIYFRPGGHPRLDGMVVQAMGDARTRGPRKGTGPRALVDPGEILDPLRMRKDPQEIRAIRAAAELTVSAFREAMGGIRPGTGEWEVESLLEAAIRRGGGSGPAFPTIAASGANACVLHYTANRARIPQSGLVLLDGGAELGLYAGDVTRTFPVDGPLQGPGLDVYRVVLEAQEAAIAQVRPGNPVSRVHEAAAAVITRGLMDLGVLSGERESLIQEEAWKPFFPHQTSHWLGLDVHDVGDYARGGQATLLAPGMVLTVEPGLYLSPEKEEIPSALKGIGIRIEDDILVTEEGFENLTGSLPRTPEALEALVGSGGVPR